MLKQRYLVPSACSKATAGYKAALPRYAVARAASFALMVFHSGCIGPACCKSSAPLVLAVEVRAQVRTGMLLAWSAYCAVMPLDLPGLMLLLHLFVAYCRAQRRPGRERSASGAGHLTLRRLAAGVRQEAGSRTDVCHLAAPRPRMAGCSLECRMHLFRPLNDPLVCMGMSFVSAWDGVLDSWSA